MKGIHPFVYISKKMAEDKNLNILAQEQTQVSEAQGDIENEKPLGRHDVDIGLESYEEALAMDPGERARIAITVRRKLDFILLPLVSGGHLN